MPLVDYANSDEESENDCEEDSTTEKFEGKKDFEKSVTTDNVGDDKNTTLFSALPKPRSQLSFLGDENKLSKLLLNNKSDKPLGKESIKISVPSVSEFDDTDQPAAKKLKPSSKGAGLFSILPPPKNASVKETTRTLVPHAVAKKQAAKIERHLKGAKSTSVVTGTEPEDDEEDTPVGSFFGLSASVESEKSNNLIVEKKPAETYTQSDIPVNQETGETGTSVNWNHAIANPYPTYNEFSVNSQEVSEESSGNFIGPEMQPLDNNPLELDEKALQILCGGKKKRQQMPMNIIDLSGEEIMPDSKEWLLKQFTEEKKVGGHSKKKGEGPSSQQRRKHQITYLAYQAKAQELELQNQWANNRMSRKQTQSKYGF